MKIALLSLKRGNSVSSDEAFVSFVVNWAFGNNKLSETQIVFGYLDQFLIAKADYLERFDYFLINFGGHNFDSKDDYQKIIKLQEKSSCFSEIHIILNKSLDWRKWEEAKIGLITNNSLLLWLHKTFQKI
ncbi:MAG: hypothetical protein PHR00_01200 [Patescibacteria group bacterium]|nr:hypothetical protein [Patescibacteria group bacterium]